VYLLWICRVLGEFTAIIGPHGKGEVDVDLNLVVEMLRLITDRGST